MLDKLARNALMVTAMSLPMLSLSIQSALAQDRRDFSVYNNNELEITELNVSSVDSGYWRYNYLDSPLLPEESGKVTFNNDSNQCMYDVRAVYSNGTYDQGRYNLCSTYFIYYYGHGGQYVLPRR
ncbi:hypothetical protein NIES22_47680 [Calothrix brevissima NIES-22]|nr:hypothetical protein NIES22_47680 [Calothrix brevissima NIES-22]